MEIMTIGEIMKRIPKDDDMKRRDYDNFIPYKFLKYNKQMNTIDVKTGWGGTYEVDLDRCKTAAACLDWIHQLHEKIWFTAEVEKEFIDLLLRLIPSKLWSGKG